MAKVDTSVSSQAPRLGAADDADITLINLPGFKHDVIFEPGLLMQKGQNFVVDKIVEWLLAQP